MFFDSVSLLEGWGISAPPLPGRREVGYIIDRRIIRQMQCEGRVATFYGSFINFFEAYCTYKYYKCTYIIALFLSCSITQLDSLITLVMLQTLDINANSIYGTVPNHACI